MAGLIEKRQTLHRSIEQIRQQKQALQSQLVHLQPLATLGSAMCMIAHEVNNLLTPVANYAELALAQPSDPDLTEKALIKVVRASRQACKVMESLINLAHGRHQERTEVSVAGLVEGVFACLARDFGKDRINVRVEVPADLTVYCVPVQLQQVLMNLILNARQAMLDTGGALHIRACTAEDGVYIEVRDTGAGIPPEIMDRIFDPFFTTKEGLMDQGQARGFGLGLSFCKLVMDAHDGHMGVWSERGCGTTFWLHLPHRPRAGPG